MVAEVTSPGGTRTGARPGSAARVLGLAGLVALAVVVLLISIGIGSRDIGLAQSWSLLWGGDGGDASGTEAAIVRDLRLPRGLLALAVGAALGLSGALMQALTRNPLADPGLLGVNLGASTAVVIAIAFLGVAHGQRLRLVRPRRRRARVGGWSTCSGSSGRASATPDRLVLAGAAVTAVLVRARQLGRAACSHRDAFNQFRFWNVGSLAGRGVDVLLAVAPFVAVGVVAGARPGPRRSTPSPSATEAGRALGRDVGRTRVLRGSSR